MLRTELIPLGMVLMAGWLIPPADISGEETAVAAASDDEAHWPRFRGPNGSGVSSARNIPVEWTEQDFRWRVELPGTGHSSPVIWKDHLYLLSANESDGTRIATCHDARSGRLLWQRAFEATAHRHHELNSLASSTPAADARGVYYCYATTDAAFIRGFDHSGEELWVTELGPFKASHGFAMSPIIHDGLIIVPQEQQGDSSLVAVDSDSGEVRWRVPRETKVTYSTPCLFRHPDGTTDVIFTNWKHGITALDPQTGKLRWERDVFDKGHVESAIGSPLVYEGLVLGTCGWLGYGTETIAVRPQATGTDATSAPQVTEVYRIDRGAPLTTTPVAANGLLFLWADNGIVTCVDAGTGKLHWRKRIGGKFYGSPIVVNDAVFCLSTDGKCVVLAASPEFRRIADNPVGEGSHSTPAVAHGRMYLRTLRHLICLGGDGT